MHYIFIIPMDYIFLPHQTSVPTPSPFHVFFVFSFYLIVIHNLLGAFSAVHRYMATWPSVAKTTVLARFKPTGHKLEVFLLLLLF